MRGWANKKSGPLLTELLDGAADQVGDASHDADRDEDDGGQVPYLELGHWPSMLSLQP